MIRSRLAQVAVTAVAAACALTACSAPPAGGAQTTTSTVTPSAASTAVDGLSDGLEVPSQAPVDRVTADAARDRAVAALRAFAATDGDAAAWWVALQPYLSVQAVDAYEGTDPALVPVHEVGTGRVLPGCTAVSCGVAVDTDAGTYTVAMTRPGEPDAVWVVSRFIPAGASR